MRYLQLHVTDCLDEAATLTTEWIHRDHIETIEAFPDAADPHRGWLQLTLTSGQTRYLPIGLDPATGLTAAASRAIASLLEHDSGPAAAAR